MTDVLHWLIANGLYHFIVGWSVGFSLGGLLVPFLRRIWKTHKSELRKIADLLDTETEGGIEELKRLVEQVLARL